MTDKELVSQIKGRFHFTARDIRAGLESYELNLIYEVFPKEPPERIRNILEKFSTGELKANIINNNIKDKKRKNIQRGVTFGRVIF